MLLNLCANESISRIPLEGRSGTAICLSLTGKRLELSSSRSRLRSKPGVDTQSQACRNGGACQHVQHLIYVLQKNGWLIRHTRQDDRYQIFLLVRRCFLRLNEDPADLLGYAVQLSQAWQISVLLPGKRSDRPLHFNIQAVRFSSFGFTIPC